MPFASRAKAPPAKRSDGLWGRERVPLYNGTSPLEHLCLENNSIQRGGGGGEGGHELWSRRKKMFILILYSRDTSVQGTLFLIPRVSPEWRFSIVRDYARPELYM